jgi:hypothetical protein
VERLNEHHVRMYAETLVRAGSQVAARRGIEGLRSVELFRLGCENWGVEPDPSALAWVERAERAPLRRSERIQIPKRWMSPCRVSRCSSV